MSEEPKPWWHALAARGRVVGRRVHAALFTMGVFTLGLMVEATLLQAVAAQGAQAPTVSAAEPQEVGPNVAARYPGDFEPLLEFGSGLTPEPATSQSPTPPADFSPFDVARRFFPTQTPTITPTRVPTAPVAPTPTYTPTLAPPAPTATPTATKIPPTNGLPQDFYLPVVSNNPSTNLELRLLDQMNAERAATGLDAYVLDTGLSQLARVRTRQLADQGYFDHTDPFGYLMYVELLSHYGYGYAWAGENLAVNNYSVSESPERAVDTLLASESHSANILADDFERVGIGEFTAPDGRHFYAIIFLG